MRVSPAIGPTGPMAQRGSCARFAACTEGSRSGVPELLAKRAKFPNFKKHGSGASFRFPDAKQFMLDEANARIKLPKLGWVRYRKSRDVRGLSRNITVSCSGDRWYASIQAQREISEPVHPALRHSPGSAVGIDLGLVRFATLSDGTYMEPLASFKTHQVRLARYQRRMARKVKGSANGKARRRSARAHK